MSFIPKNQVSEDEILRDVLHTSEIFNKFYKTERTRLKHEILWYFERELASAASFSSTHIDGKRYHIIVVKNMPIDNENVIHVAHEIQHLLCFEEGYPIILLRDKNINNDNILKVPKLISDMINDTIVSDRLSKHGFSIRNYYEEGKNYYISTFKDKNKHSISFEAGLLLICTYVKKTFEWEFVKRSDPNAPSSNEFVEWMENDYPELIPDARKFLEIIQEIGYDSPEKVHKIFTRILNRSGLIDRLEITYYN